MLGNLIATAAALQITSGRGRPLGGHLDVQVTAVHHSGDAPVVGPQHWRRRRGIGRGRIVGGGGGVDDRRNQRLADVEPRRGQVVDGAVFAQYVDLLRGTAASAGHGIVHAEVVRFVGASGSRVVQVVVFSVEIFVAILVLDFIVNMILIIDCIVVGIGHICIKIFLTFREILYGIRSVRSN